MPDAVVNQLRQAIASTGDASAKLRQAARDAARAGTAAHEAERDQAPPPPDQAGTP